MKNNNLLVGAIAIGAIYLLTRNKKTKATKASKTTSGGGGGGVPTGDGMVVGGSRPTMKQCIANPDLVGCEKVLPELRNELTRDLAVRDVYGDAILDIFVTDPLGTTRDSTGQEVGAGEGEGSSSESEPISSPPPSLPTPSNPVVSPSLPVISPSLPVLSPSNPVVSPSLPVVSPSLPVGKQTGGGLTPVSPTPIGDISIVPNPIGGLTPVSPTPIGNIGSGNAVASPSGSIQVDSNFVGMRMDVPKPSEISSNRTKGSYDSFDFDGEYGTFIDDGF